MQLAQILFAASAAGFGALGALHLLFTFHGVRLHPRDPALRQAMERVHPVITRQTTMWRANKGFNATHSLGIVSFGLVYGYLALWRFEVLGGSGFLLGLGAVVLAAYGVLARRYFFSVPFRGVALALLLYAGGWALA